VTLVAMQGGHHDPTSGQGNIPVNTASHVGCKVTQPHHAGSTPGHLINMVCSNKPGNSFLRKNLYVPHVKLLSKTNGPINLLLS